MPTPMTLPSWMRYTLFATAVMNVVAAAAFLPDAQALRDLAGFPAVGHSFYSVFLGVLVLIFGLGYLYAAATGSADRLFIAVSAAGKLSFFGLLVGYWVAGALPFRAPLAGAADLVFGVAFLFWLSTARTPS